MYNNYSFIFLTVMANRFLLQPIQPNAGMDFIKANLPWQALMCMLYGHKQIADWKNKKAVSY